jgi:hypothetical protein
MKAAAGAVLERMRAWLPDVEALHHVSISRPRPRPNALPVVAQASFPGSVHRMYGSCGSNSRLGDQPQAVNAKDIS